MARLLRFILVPVTYGKHVPSFNVSKDFPPEIRKELFAPLVNLVAVKLLSMVVTCSIRFRGFLRRDQ